MEKNNDSFGRNIGRGFAQGIGTILAYGIALLVLSLLTKDQDEQAEAQTQTQSVGGSCSAWT